VRPHARSLSPSYSHHVVLHRWCAVDAAESGVDILRCFADGWPRAFRSSVVDAAAASCCSDSMAHHTDGWLRPTNAARPLIHALSGRRRSAWRHARFRWTPGTAAAGDAVRCVEQRRRRRRRRQPLQQVASSVCSLSASSTSVTQPCSI